MSLIKIKPQTKDPNYEKYLEIKRLYERFGIDFDNILLNIHKLMILKKEAEI